MTAAVLTVSMGVGLTTSHADPAPADVPVLHGEDGGVPFETTITDDGSSLTTVLDAGSFRVAADDASVAVLLADGTELGSIPLVYRVGDQQFTIAPLVGRGGTSLTLTPDTDPARAVTVAEAPAALPLTDIDGRQRFMDLLNYSAFGGLTGAGIGAAIGLGLGCVIGVIVGCVPGVLVGAAAGGLIGLYNAGGPALVQAGFDYVTGAP